MTTYMTRNDWGVGDGLYDSIAWIFSVHIKEPDTGEYNFAVFHGSDDSPTKIELWCDEPNYNSPPDRVCEADNVLRKELSESFGYTICGVIIQGGHDSGLFCTRPSGHTEGHEARP